ncbi:YwqG family protein [Thermoactinomyces sp. DSM 45892]|uniref:YwqG family protein n=1 Tax=Thermoactinomyces sp. DSM 45892 TaxID=1882753 RepID=UPI00089BB664|nr:Uncharacterized protein YwqG [Thermoactinomyces sp. DSM 45892]
MQNKLELPTVLETYREVLEKTVRPYIHITARKGSTTLFQSKFGGKPYLPLTVDHPVDENGNPMMLLAQLNFEELPRLEFFPESGILQLFISYDDDLWGLNFDDPTNQKNFRTVYYPVLMNDESSLVTQFSHIDEINGKEMYTPITEEYQLSYQLKYEAVSSGDHRFERFTSGKINLDSEVEVDGEMSDMWEHVVDALSAWEHKVGGYPAFTQEDPRYRHSDYDILLLQIVSDDSEGNDIMWGDFGVGNWFIKKKDLLNQNFSKVLYNWDCC